MNVNQAAAVGSQIQQARTQQQIDTAVAAKISQSQKQAGDNAVKLIEQAAAVGRNGRGLDLRA